MAYSTQKDFFYVPYMNESMEEDGEGSNVKMKSYEAAMDERSWAMDDQKKSNFLHDLVSGFTVQRSRGADGAGGGSGEGLGADGDSLLEVANEQLAAYQKLLNKNNQLEKELKASNERLKTAKDENRRIKQTLAGPKLDDDVVKEFANKMNKLAKDGKIDKNEKGEMDQLQKKLENTAKAFDVLRGENNYLRRLIDKQAARCNLDSIPTKPEESSDVDYLRKEIDKLRKEVILLRKMEENYLKLKHECDKKAGQSQLSDQDADNIRMIIEERNALRDRVKAVKSMEKKINDLQQKEKDLKDNLNDQNKYINGMEGEIGKMQKYYEDQCKMCDDRECQLKCELDNCKEELTQAKALAQKSEMLQMEINCLRNEIMKRDLALGDYDCQYKQLMEVVEELQNTRKECEKKSGDDLAYDEEEEDLAYYTQQTLSEITKEIARGDLDDSCQKELDALRGKVNQLEKERFKAADCQSICDDALKRLEELERLNAKLQGDNDKLNQTLRDGGQKFTDMARKVDMMEDDLGKTARKSKDIGKNIDDTLKLVKDISDMQLKNHALTKEVQEENDRLRRQLDDGSADKKQKDGANEAEKQKAAQRAADAAAEKAGQQPGQQAGQQPGQKPGEAGQKPGQQPGEAAQKPGQQPGQQPEQAGQQPGQKPGQQPGEAGQKPGQQADQKPGQAGAQGAGAKGADAQGAGAKGADAQGAGAKGADAQGAGAKGAGAPGGGAKGADAQGAGAKGADAQGAGAKGAGAPGAGAKGADAKGADAQGAGAQGAGAKGADAQGAGAKGAAAPGAGAKGADAQGAGAQGPGAKGADAQGAGAKGADAQGAGQAPGQAAGQKPGQAPGEGAGPAAGQAPGQAAGPAAGQGPGAGQGAGQEGAPGAGQAGAPGAGQAGAPGAGPGAGKGAGQAGGKAGQKPGQGAAGAMGEPGDETGEGVPGALGRAGGQPSPGRGGAPTSGRRGGRGKPSGDAGDEQAAVNAFVEKNATGARFSLGNAAAFEKELRRILDEFIQECGFCFCRLVHPKSKLYAICHKLYHCGINTLTFRDLAYLHKKVYTQAEKILPGCLLDMILTDHAKTARQVIENINREKGGMAKPTTLSVDVQTNSELLKCCNCKNELCCNQSEEDLKMKVFQLEQDIENAKEYLDNLKAMPIYEVPSFDVLPSRQHSYRRERNNLTFRASEEITPRQRSPRLRSMKSRALKRQELHRW